ncbi:MAG: endoglucanase [Actinomycetota bacterium]|nr:endoglucanase [Actinomycetota bacterium]
MSHEERALKVSGDRTIDGTGATVRLRGLGLGGWMTMENFITGHPATETQTRAALHRVELEKLLTGDTRPPA